MPEQRAVVGRRFPPLLPPIVPGLIILDHAGSVECRSRPRLVKVCDIDQAFGSFHANFVEHIRFIQIEIGEGDCDPHLASLLEQVSGIGKPIARINNFRAGGLDLLEIRGKIREEKLVVIFSYDLRLRIVFLQTMLKSVGHAAAKGVILAKDVEFLFLLADLAVIIGHAAANGLGGVGTHKGIPIEVCSILKIIGQGADILSNDFVFTGHLVDDLLDITARGAQQDMDFLLEDHALADFLGLIRPGHAVRLEQGNLFLLAVHQNTAALIDIVGGKSHTSPGELTVQCAGTRMGPYHGDLDGIALGIDPFGRVIAGHIAHLGGIKSRVGFGPCFPSLLIITGFSRRRFLRLLSRFLGHGWRRTIYRHCKKEKNTHENR